MTNQKYMSAFEAYVDYTTRNFAQYMNEIFEPRIKLDSNIKQVIFNPPATIVFWNDGTKTVVKCCPDEIFDKEKGLAMALLKKAHGNKSDYFNQYKKWLEEN